MKVIEVKVYPFDELSGEIRQKVIEKYYDINVNHDWYQSTYDDAAHIGLDIEAFDLDRASYVKGKFTASPKQVAENIISEHGESCETRKTAEAFLAAYDNLSTKEENGELENEEMIFLESICDDYLKILRDEYDYLTGKEAIIETIKANEYTFRENGVMFNG